MRWLWLSFAMALLACGSASAGDVAADAAAGAASADGGEAGVTDAFPSDHISSDGAPLDAQGTDAGGLDAVAGNYCAQCVAQRCDATALTCEQDPDCAAEAQCVVTCNSTGCAQSCTASMPSNAAAAGDLASCLGSSCLLPCFSGDAGGGQACAKLGFSCDPLVPAFTCCAGQGTCATPGTPDSYCCNPAGGSCTADADCCPANGIEGSCVSGQCQQTTCWPAPGSCDTTLPCCDPQMICHPTGGPGGSLCCYPGGVVLASASDSELCCSAGVTTSASGVVTCVP
jgi:hypothetical protein